MKQELLEEAFPLFETAQKEVAIACSTYNHLRPHGSINNLKPAEAHEKRGKLTKRWKNYWQLKKEREVIMVLVFLGIAGCIIKKSTTSVNLVTD